MPKASEFERNEAALEKLAAQAIALRDAFALRAAEVRAVDPSDWLAANDDASQRVARDADDALAVVDALGPAVARLVASAQLRLWIDARGGPSGGVSAPSFNGRTVEATVADLRGGIDRLAEPPQVPEATALRETAPAA